MHLVPDPRHYRKQWMTLGTLTALLALGGGVASAVIALVGGSSGAIPTVWIVLGSVAGALWLIATPIVYLWIKNLSYRIETDKVIINKGVLTKTQQNIPIRMVTDFRLQRSLYDRWLGIGSILVQTAGQTQTASGYEGKLAGLAGWQGLHEELQSLVADVDLGGSLGRDRPASGDLPELAEDVHAIRRHLERSAL